MKEIKRVSAGVMFESDVLKFIDLVAAEQRRNRSFIINQIIRQHARWMQQQRQTEQSALQPVSVGPLAVITL